MVCRVEWVNSNREEAGVVGYSPTKDSPKHHTNASESVVEDIVQEFTRLESYVDV